MKGKLGFIIGIFMFIILVGGVSAAVVDSHGQNLSNAGAETRDAGAKIRPSKDVLLTTVTKNASINADTAYLLNASQEIIASASFVGNNATFSSVPLTEDIIYIIALNNSNGSSYNSYRTADLSGSYPLVGTNIDYHRGYLSDQPSNGNFTRMYNFFSVTTLTASVENLTISLDNPSNNAGNIATTQIFNATLTPGATTLKNATLYVWYSNGSLFNKTTKPLSGSSPASVGWNITSFPLGVFEWQVEGYSSNSTLVRAIAGNRTLTIGYTPIANNSVGTLYETDNAFYQFNITTNGSVPTANLVFNGTSYSATVSSIAGDNYSLSRTVAVPLGGGNITYLWNILYGTTGINSSTSNDVVNGISFGVCNATLTTKYLNVTVKDETNLTVLPYSVPSSTFNYYLGSGTINKSYTYSNTTEGNSTHFCFSPASKTLNTTVSFQYETTNHPQRIWSTDTQSLSNTTLNKILYLLSTSKGLYVTFQVINTAEQPLSDVIATALRVISGSDVLVGSGITGSDGGVTFFLNPNFLHTLSFAKTGFDTFTTSLFPTQSSYTITLGGGSTDAENDYNRGISYSVRPLSGGLINDTTYNFNFTISSSLWSLDEFGFVLTNGSGSVITTKTSTSSSGGIVSANVNTASNSSIKMNYYWVVNSTYQNATVSWIVYDSSGNSFSIFHFAQDLALYVSSGFFGLDSFGLAILSFVFIFVFTGVMSYRYGLNSPAAIMGLIFSLTLFLDVGIGIIPSPPGVPTGIPFPTIFVGMILIATLIREGSR